MNPRLTLGIVVSIYSLFLAAGCGRRSAAAEDPAPSLEPTSATVFGERLLLFMEYPHLVRGVPARFLAHLTLLGSGEPIRSGTVTLEIGTSRFAIAAPKREGLFIPEGSFTESGRFPGRLIVRSDQAEESLELGEVVVHASEGDAAAAASSSAGDEPPNAVPFLMEQQWKVKLLLAAAAPRLLTERLIVPARAAAPEGSSAVVSPPVGGRLMAPHSGSLPRTGERVEAGQTLARVEPPLGAPEVAQLRSFGLELDLMALDTIRAVGEAQARLRFAEREQERIGKLRAEGLSTQQQLDQAEQNLAVAMTELEAASRRHESLDRLVANRGGETQGNPGPAIQLPLNAPIAGNVVVVLGVEGESVGPETPVFRVLDASRIWVEGRVSEFDLARVREARHAVARFPAIPAREFELSGIRDGKPYLGPEVDPSSRTLIVRYELENPDDSVRVGMLAELHIATGEHQAAVAIPTEAVISDQGLPTAYVMLEGELFQKRELEVGPKDERWIEVVRGIEPGERVAARGAYIIKLAALSPASFGPGHAH